MSKCTHDPKQTTGPIGMYHCPDCGDMVLAGIDHPDMDDVDAKLDQYYDEQFEALLSYLINQLGRESGIPFIHLIESDEKIKKTLMEIWLRADFNEDRNCEHCGKNVFGRFLFCSPFCEKVEDFKQNNLTPIHSDEIMKRLKELE